MEESARARQATRPPLTVLGEVRPSSHLVQPRDTWLGEDGLV